jgi:two-component system sensor histidine kinase QseC
MIRSLGGRVLALVLGLVAAVWVATALATWLDARHELDELLDGHLAQAAALLVVHQARGIEDEEHAVDAPSLHRYAPKVAFQVFHEGRLVLRSENAPRHPMLERGRFRGGFRTVRIGGVDWRVFATRGRESDVQVYVGEQVASRSAILLAVLRGALWPLALALPTLGLAAWWAVRRGVAPLRRLAVALDRREPQALEPIALAGAPLEVVSVVAALNRLFERIRDLLESERRFTADAAHELRTPIAAIRAQAQVALAESDDAQRRRALEGTLAGCDRLVRLVEQLLMLSRLEAASGGETTLVDLASVARRAVAEIAPRAIARDQALDFHAEGACPIRGEETLLGVLVRNLVDNAVRYAPRGARIAVAVQRVNERVALRVEDSGPGMSEPERRRLGERFFRVAGSAESGSGLGWSIVRRIAATHGLEVRVGSSSRLGGLEVEVSGRSAPRTALV